MAKRVVLLLVLLIAVLVAALTVNSARAFRERVFSDPRATTTVILRTPSGDMEEMPWSTFMLKRVAPRQLNVVSYWLVSQPIGILWGILYALGGLAGGCIYLLLLIVEPGALKKLTADVDAALQMGRLTARLIVATAAGLLSYFVLMLPASVAIVPLQSVGAHPSDLYASLLLLPAASGIFVSTFFEKIRAWLERVLTAPKTGGTKDATNP